MNNFTLIREIIGKPWAIDAAYAFLIGHAVQSFLEKSKTYTSSYSIDESLREDVADISTIHIKGELLKNDTGSGKMGMATIGKLLEKNDSNSDIKGHILIIDSPGGTVDGTMELVEIIRAITKPIVSVVDGMAASAAYWIAAATDKIISKNAYNKVGSIGVMLSFADMQPMYEKAGVKFHRVYATQSPDKNKMIEKLLAGDYEEYIKSNLNPLAEEFINSVQSFRQNITDKQVTGKTFFAKEVIGSMIDEIGTFQDAVNYIYSQTQKSNSMFNKKSKETGLSNEELAAKFEQDISVVQNQLNEYQTEIEKLKAENAKLARDKNETEQQLSTALDEVEKLKQADGAMSAKAVKETDAIKTGEQTVYSENASLAENIAKIKEAYL